MVTIKDIARLAGVSHGTVSNVINKKGNVSSEKMQLVEQAAQALGYTANAQAQRLRKESSRHVAVLLPNLFSEQYSGFYTSFYQPMQAAGFEVSLHLTHGSTQEESRCVAHAMTLCPICLVVVDPTPQLAMPPVSALPVVLVNASMDGAQGQPSPHSFGFDFIRVAEDIFERVTGAGCPRLVFFGDSRNSTTDAFLSQALRRLADKAGIAFADHACQQRFLHLGAIDLAETCGEADWVIAASQERLHILTDIFALKALPLPHMVAVAAKQPASSPHFFRYELDYARVGRQLARALSERPPSELPAATLLPPTGFRFDFDTIHIQPREQELSLLTLDSPTATVITKLSPHFKQLTGIRLRTSMLPYDELFSSLGCFGVSGHDLVRMDMMWRPSLEQQVCKPLSACINQLEPLWSRFLPELCSAYRSDYTLPIDPSVQMMLYRRDLFEDATLRRLYYEEMRGELQLPTTFEEFNRIARFFTAALNPRSPVQYGTVNNYGLSTVATCDFMPRFRGMEGSFFDDNGLLVLDTPPMRQALDSYLESLDYSPRQLFHWWSDSLAQFTDGRAAMVSVFVNHASRAASSQNAEGIDLAGCAPVPGGTPCLGGGCIGIAVGSQKDQQCLEFFKWIYSGEISSLITMMGGLTPVASAYEDEQLCSLYPWLGGMRRQFFQGARHNSSPQYPDFNDYRFELILGTTVRNLAMGVVPMDEALKMAQAACDQQFIPRNLSR